MNDINKLIDALEQSGDGCGLISDDAGNWAVSTSGFRMSSGTTFFVEADEWKPTIREALQAYFDEHHDDN